MLPQAAPHRNGTRIFRLLEEVLEGLPFRRRTLEGVPTFFAGEAGFAFVWQGRLGLIFREAGDADALMAVPEAAPWAIHPTLPPAPNTVLVPLAWLEDPDRLAPWVQRAHAQASTAAPHRAR